jgi:hypothetical protein
MLAGSQSWRPTFDQSFAQANRMKSFYHKSAIVVRYFLASSLEWQRMYSLNDNQSKMKTILKNICIGLSLVCFVSFANKLLGQVASARHHVLIDVAHGQKFWNDPTAMPGMDPNFIERVKYMTAEITKTATSVNADVGYIKNKIKSTDLAKCDLLFIHLPSLKYEADEAKAINQYVQNGGNLFLVMDVDYWSTSALFYKLNRFL